MGMDLIGIRLERPLSDAGWERRFVAAPDRAKEAAQLYTDMGFEVRIEEVSKDELGPQCGACCEAVCKSYVSIYTRKRGRGSE